MEARLKALPRLRKLEWFDRNQAGAVTGCAEVTAVNR
jgi:hypothetical protein